MEWTPPHCPTLIPHVIVPQTNSATDILSFENPRSYTKYCDSAECSDGISLIVDAKDVKCERAKCVLSHCCEPVCSHYKCLRPE